MINLKYLKEFNNILEKTPENENLIYTFINYISNIFNTDIYLIDKKGNIVEQINKSLISFSLKNYLNDNNKIEYQLLNQLNNINHIKFNISLENLYVNNIDKQILKEYFGIFIPIKMQNNKLGTLVIFQKQKKFADDFIYIAEYIKSILSILLHNSKNLQFFEDDRKKNIVKSAIDILSFTELEAILSVFEELNGEKEGLLIASKIADKKGITRSVIVNALRKFESAGLIESRSLGMKGTYIKILNEYLLPEINKFKK